jgi:hypothetical protein
MNVPDDKALVKAASQGAAEGAVRAALEPFVGPISESSGIVTDLIRFQRWKVQHWILERAEAFVAARGGRRAYVPLKILVPLLELGSLEDEDDAAANEMIDRWAALLANAAIAKGGPAVLPAFATILSQLVSQHALILDTLCRLESDAWDEGRYTEEAPTNESGVEEDHGVPVIDLAGASGLPFDLQFLLLVDDLERLGLMHVPVPITYGGTRQLFHRQRGLVSGSARVTLSFYGRAFVEACQAPEADTGAQTGAQRQ